jgi:hypothetical protein
VGWRGGKALGCEDSRDERREKLSRVPLHSITTLSSDINLGRAAYGEILNFIWGKLLRGEMFMLILGGLHERQAKII